MWRYTSGVPAPPRSTASDREPWTTRRLMAWITDALARHHADSPRLCAEMLLAHVIGCDRLRLYMEIDRPATPLERESLRELVSRAMNDEPVQYLVGEAWFYGLPMTVDRRVLIPRHCTETIVEQVLHHARSEPGFGGPAGQGVTIGDVCTGSGAVAIAILKNLKGARALATDVSPEALELARRNADRHAVADRADFLAGDLLNPIRDHPAGHGLHYVVSNPPYIPDHEWQEVARNVKDFEPEIALRGGPDGLRFVRPIIEQAPACLRPHGLLLVEIAACTAGAVLRLAEGHPLLRTPRIVKDGDGLPRVLVATRN